MKKHTIETKLLSISMEKRPHQKMRSRCRQRSSEKCLNALSPQIVKWNSDSKSGSKIRCWGPSTALLCLLFSTVCMSTTNNLMANAYAYHTFHPASLRYQNNNKYCQTNRYLQRQRHCSVTSSSSCFCQMRQKQHRSKKLAFFMSTSTETSGNQTMTYGSATETENDDKDVTISHVEQSSVSSDSSSSQQLPEWLQKQIAANQVMDVPRPTENGGYSHTTVSRAKISAANKGKTPWNKGKGRSEATKAKIAEGVRRRNREQFLKKLEEMGMTEEEYEAQQAKEKAKKAADKLARKTEKGGYRPTEETKQKISKILKEKWAKGEVKKRSVDPSKVRRGFTHSEETRAKISASLRKRWADDEEYRENMIQKSHTSNTREDVRKRISESLRKKWQDPEFREEMTAKMATRKRSTTSHGTSHREKISAAMKKRWRDKEYRQRATDGMKKKQAELAKLRPPKARKTRPPRAKNVEFRPVAVKKGSTTVPSVSNGNSIAALLNQDDNQDGLRLAQPMVSPKKKVKGVRKKKATSAAKTVAKKSSPLPVKKKKKKKKTKKKLQSSDVSAASNSSTTASKKKEGSKSRLREERRDLYDLLYGDEDDHDDMFDIDEGKVGSALPTSNNNMDLQSSNLASVFLEDEDLDDFDPYGLDDF